MEDDDPMEEAVWEEAPAVILAELRRSAWIEAGVTPAERFTHVTKIKKAEWADEDASKAVRGELKQLFHEELNALKPLKTEPPGAVVLESHMFVNRKHSATGEYEKTKARFIAEGGGQDAKLYPDKLSPTLATHILWFVLAMYAGLSGYLMSKVDVKGAFLETHMEGAPVYMRVRRNIVTYLLAMY